MAERSHADRNRRRDLGDRHMFPGGNMAAPGDRSIILLVVESCAAGRVPHSKEETLMIKRMKEGTIDDIRGAEENNAAAEDCANIS